jgi:hypothetical protein
LKLRLVCVLAALFITGSGSVDAEVRNRQVILVDTSSTMLRTPQIVDLSVTCAGWNPCTFNGNPSVAQESCNACVRDTIRFEASCATLWDTSCRAGYASCLSAVTGQSTCSPTMMVVDSLVTRGDGSVELPGCDLNGDGLTNESRIYKVKGALQSLFDAHDEVAFSLWGLAQVTGGQTCASDADCPEGPKGLSLLTCEDLDPTGGTNLRCAFDADRLDGPTAAGFEGQCARATFTGAPSSFGCQHCDWATTFDRATCEAYALNQAATGAVSRLDLSSTVSCFPIANPVHRFQSRHGAYTLGDSCDPSGGESLVGFPACDPAALCDNRLQIAQWLDGEEAVFGQDAELRALGLRPLAAALRDLKDSLLATMTGDLHSACRRYDIVVITAGTETCSNPDELVAAATELQNLSFTNAGGIFVADYDVEVNFVGYGLCPPSAPDCAAAASLNQAAAAAGGVLFQVESELELALALEQLADETATSGFSCGLFSDGFESGDTSAWS